MALREAEFFEELDGHACALLRLLELEEVGGAGRAP